MTTATRTPHWFSEPADLFATVVDDGTITSVSPSSARVLGFQPHELIGRRWADFVCPDDLESTSEFLESLAQHRAEERGFVNRYRRSDGGEVWLEWTAQLVDGLVYVAGRDITRERETAQRLARSERLWRACFEQAPIGMCLTTEDGSFVEVNPAFAALFGVEPERLVGGSIVTLVPPDERERVWEDFGRVIHGEVERYATERRYVRSDGEEVWGHAAVSAVTTQDGRRCLLAQVLDITQRKREEEALSEEFRAVASLERLRDALDRDRLVLFAQPIVDLRTSEVVREELLVRMEDDDGRPVAPAEFLPAAERFGLVAQIDRWVLRRAIVVAATGRAVNVNVSARSLSDDLLLHDVREAVEAGLDPAHLGFEITETALADDLDAVRGFASRVRGLGSPLAIDDFGAGYSGLLQLKHLGPLATSLKIDRGFITHLVDDPEAQRIVEATVGLAAGFGQTTVAEGIEDAATAEHLLAAGVTHGQGYLFGRPAPVSGAS